jgi:hypothetical protein
MVMGNYVEKNYKKGFSLIEVAAVLTTLALVITGVVSGKALFDSASQRKVIADYEKIIGSTTLFKTTYFALPGDISNAYKYWPDPQCLEPAGCSGNNNGTVDSYEFSNLDVSLSGGYSYFETDLFFPQLSWSELIDEPYTSEQIIEAAESNQTSIDSSTYYQSSDDKNFAVFGPGGIEFPGNGNANAYGGSNGSINAKENANVISMGNEWEYEESITIDEKIDDDNIETGNIISFNPSDNAKCKKKDTDCTVISIGPF